MREYMPIILIDHLTRTEGLHDVLGRHNLVYMHITYMHTYIPAYTRRRESKGIDETECDQGHHAYRHVHMHAHRNTDMDAYLHSTHTYTNFLEHAQTPHLTITHGRLKG
jgi:hypothetical protein